MTPEHEHEERRTPFDQDGQLEREEAPEKEPNEDGSWPAEEGEDPNAPHGDNQPGEMNGPQTEGANP